VLHQLDEIEYLAQRRKVAGSLSEIIWVSRIVFTIIQALAWNLRDTAYFLVTRVAVSRNQFRTAVT
jgi:hypothetical protein